MLSEGWCDVVEDGSSQVICPFHALPFDAQGRTVLPGTKQKTLPQLQPLALVIQGDFVPEAEYRTRTYILLFVQARHPAFKVLGSSYLKFGKVAVEQDVDILYAHAPQKIKLNNEVGMDWVKRNFAHFPAVVEPNLSRGDRPTDILLPFAVDPVP